MALDLLQAMMDLHGAGLSRIVEVLGEAQQRAEGAGEAGHDPLVCRLMVLYGVHPAGLEERVRSAKERSGHELASKVEG